MYSFSAYLTVASFQTWINAASIQMHQEVDELWRPASPTFGGTLTVTFNATADPLVADWMFDPARQHNGALTYLDPNGGTLKVVEFDNAFCSNMHEEFDGTTSSMQMLTTLVISPERLRVSGIGHDNHWPPIEAH